MKKARWIYTTKRGGLRYTVVATLRAGAKGRGRILGSYEYWPNEPKSCDAADRCAAEIERRAQVQVCNDWDDV